MFKNMELILRLSLLILTLSVLAVNGRHTADPPFNAATLTDFHGNTANQDSVISWAAVSTSVSYKGDNMAYSDGGLGALNSMAKGFVNVCFPSGFPWEAAEKAMNGTITDDVVTNWQTYAKQFAGYAVCIVVGLLFIIIFPIVGCCFCCCRCCGCCGGKMVQKRKDVNNSCRRRVYVVASLVVIVFIGSGMLCVFISNDQFTKAVDNLDGSVSDTIDDMFTFVNATVDQVTHLVKDNFNFTTDVIKRDLDGMGYLVGVPLRTAVGTVGGMEACINNTYDLINVINNATRDLFAVNTALTAVDTAYTALNTALLTLKTSLDTDLGSCTAGVSAAACGAVSTSGLVANMDATSLPDISSQVTKATDIQNANMTAKVLEGEEGWWEIPWKVYNDTKSTVQTLIVKIDEMADVLNTAVGTIDDARSSLQSTFDTDSLTSSIDDYMTMAKTYNQYRWYGGIGLACIVLLVVVLQLLGLVFGMIGYDSKSDPRDRGCMSNSGGNMFMASVGFVFIFSSLLMLLTLLTYLIGAPLERFICQPITDSDMVDLDRLVDDIAYKQMYGSGSGTGSLFGEILYSNASYTIPLSGILKDCQSSKTAYTTFKVKKYVNLSQVENYRSEFNIQSELDKIDGEVDFSSVTILTPALLSNLEDAKVAVNVDFSSFTTELSKDLTQVNLTNFANSLRTLATTAGAAGDSSTQTKMNNHATTLDNIDSNEFATLNAAVANLTRDLNTMSTTVSGMSAQVDSVIACLNTTQIFLRTNTSTVLKNTVLAYANRIFGIVDSFINKTFDALEGQVGKCDPLWNLYNNLFVITLCSYTVNTLNGFWFGLGWCIFFFVPSIIFAVKLAKHFRRMKEVEPEKDTIHGNYEEENIPVKQELPSANTHTNRSVYAIPDRPPSQALYPRLEQAIHNPNNSPIDPQNSPTINTNTEQSGPNTSSPSNGSRSRPPSSASRKSGDGVAMFRGNKVGHSDDSSKASEAYPAYAEVAW